MKWLFLLIIPVAVWAQTRVDGLISNGSVSIGNKSAANSKSVLDVHSTTKGVLVPRMTNAQRDAISSPTESLLIWSTTDSAYQFYKTTWRTLGENFPLTTKGDIAVYSSSNDRLAVGTHGQVLTSNTGSASGLAWADASGGGGGGSLQWIEDANAPTPSIENNTQVYSFGNSLSQELYTYVKVPDSYVAGNQINLRLLFYSSGTLDTVWLQSQSTLLEPGDAFTDTTDQHTSTNAAVTLDAPANEVRSSVLDLSNASGQVNSNAIAAGDLLKVRVYRTSDTSSLDAKLLPYAAEATFQP